LTLADLDRTDLLGLYEDFTKVYHYDPCGDSEKALRHEIERMELPHDTDKSDVYRELQRRLEG
jgi:hypothetical protein